MATITISDQDLQDADAFLTAYLSEKIPDADFSRGGVVRDFVITALAHVFAFLESERKTTRDQQSLLALSKLTDDQSVQDGVNAILSNWFLNRKTGLYARLTATLHFSQAADIPLTPTLQFFRTASLVFLPDIAESTVIPASQLIPTFDANNVVVDYTTTVPMVAQNVGQSYTVDAGRFLSADLFSPYFTYAENQSASQGAKDVESTAELLQRAPTAITVRNLVNVRSIDTVLRELFPGLTRVLSLGFGDPEMLRDFSSEAVTHLRMHVGGFTDVYVQLPITEVVETGTLGGVFSRPDNVAAVFRDSAGTTNFVTAGVVPGDVLRITSGIPNAPREFIIDTVATNVLTINPRASFTVATDEAGTYVSYTIGHIAPNFDDVMQVTTTGQTSRAIQTPGRITLQGRPHYRVKQVEIYRVSDPSSVTVLTARVNTAPGSAEYRMVSWVPGNAQSAYAVDQIEVSTGGRLSETWNARVTYDTLVGYADVQAYIVDRFQRVLASNALAKGYIPVYVSLNIAYRLKVGATAALDTVAVAQSVASFVATFDLTEMLDMTALTQHIRDTFPSIGVIVSPTVLTYNLYAPDGQIYSYRTNDIVTIFPSYPDNNAHLTNGLELQVPIPNADLDPSDPANVDLFAAANDTLKTQLSNLGVSDRTVVYITRASDVTLTLVP